MFSSEVIVLQLLLVSLTSGSHFYGSHVTFTAKRDSNGNYGVEVRNKATYRGCGFNYGPCYSGNCGTDNQLEAGLIDSSSNGPAASAPGWCESETIVTKTLTSDKPFQMLEYSCCWISLNYGYPSWSVLTSVDLGRRSDTNAPNNSPDVAILPFLRVPQNCRRTYKPMSFDPDGDVVRCRYGTGFPECYSCGQHYGFQVDEASCTVQYLASAVQGVYGFELVVEDFPHSNVRLYYSDSSSSYKYPRSKRAATLAATTAAITVTTAAPTTITTLLATTTAPTTTTRTTAATTTAATTTAATTTAATTTAATTTAAATTAAQATTTAATTTAATTTAAATTAAQATTTAATTTAAQATTTAATTTAATTTAAATTAAQATTTAATTTAATTTAATTITVTSTTTPRPTTTTPWPTTTTPWPTTTTPWPTTTTPWPTTTTTSYRTPFSQLPLQFTFQVDPPAPSCTEGDYLPRFVSPTPRHGEVLLAEAGKEVEIKVKAEAQYSVLDNIIMSGPLNITKHRTTGDVFALRWTPVRENVGNYFPVCFAVEFTYGSAIYQTEMRCVVLNVTNDQVNTVVTCLESAMIVEVEKATLPRLHYDHLRLSDPSNTICDLQTHSNSTHVVAVVPLNACGTQVEEDDDDLLFKNEITTVDNTSHVITRRHQLEIKFFCQYSKRGNVTLTFFAHRDKVTVWDKGLGTFTYGFEFYPDQRFQSMIDPRLYPLEYDVGDRIFMEIEATTTVNNTELFVESCRATPYDTSNYPNTYSLIENGCNQDSTIIVYPTSNPREFKFSLEAFKFIGLHDQVYISCSVLMCEAGKPNTRCSQGCLPNAPRRARREAEEVIESRTHFVSQGPLRLRRSVESAGNTGLNLNLVFIAGCALAAVGMICGVVFYKTKRSSVNYQLLPSDES